MKEMQTKKYLDKDDYHGISTIRLWDRSKCSRRDWLDRRGVCTGKMTDGWWDGQAFFNERRS